MNFGHKKKMTWALKDIYSQTCVLHTLTVYIETYQVYNHSNIPILAYLQLFLRVMSVQYANIIMQTLFLYAYLIMDIVGFICNNHHIHSILDKNIYLSAQLVFILIIYNLSDIHVLSYTPMSDMHA